MMESFKDHRLDEDASFSALADHHTEHYVIPGDNVDHDLEQSIRDVQPRLSSILNETYFGLAPQFAFRFQVRLSVMMERYDLARNEIISGPFYFNSESQIVCTPDDMDGKLATALQRIIVQFDTFVKLGSGWNVTRVLSINLVVCKFELYSGGCLKLSILPKFLQTKTKTLLSCDNDDNKCFVYSLVMAMNQKDRGKNKWRFSKSDQKILNKLPPCPAFPVTIKDVIKYEGLVPALSINVYGYDKGFVPYYISPFLKKRKLHADLFLHEGHFYAITNLASLARSSSRSHERKTFCCKRCLSLCTSQLKFQVHEQLCSGNVLPLKMPDDKECRFKNYSRMVEAPFVIYADLESCIGEVEKSESSSSKLISKRKHTIVSWACITVCRPNPEFSSPPVTYTGKDPVNHLLDYLQRERSRIYSVLDQENSPMLWDQHAEIAHNKQTHCRMCNSEFIENDCLRIHQKVRDHCHLTGRYRQALCSRCNITHAKTKPFEKVVVFFHGLSNYDSHFLIQQLHRYKTKDMWVIPRTSEKFSAFSARGLIFKDSYQFLSESLNQLMANLKTKGEHNFVHLRKYFESDEERALICRKGVFPYNYLSSLDKLKETSLPPIEEFYNDLTMSSISPEEYDFAKQVWDVCECRNLGDYLRVYLLADVLGLADCFESFRTNCLADYDLDPVYYFSNANFTWDAFLRKTNVCIDLLQDVNQYLWLSNEAIRGGLSVVSKRLAIANHPNVEGYDPNKSKSAILYLDCNNLYGYCMMSYLPVGDFEWEESYDNELIQTILELAEDSDEGYILEVDLDYPVAIHDAHSDYPLAPHRFSVPKEKLSPTARKICEKFNLKSCINTPKLMATLYPRKNYVLHYRNLQYYIQQGLKLERVHRILKFRQEPLMKEYILFNSMRRAQSNNDFDTNFYKFLSNSLFGKTMERVDKRKVVRLVSDIKSYVNYVAKVTFESAKIVNENLVSIQMKRNQIVVDRPVFLGFSILELAKLKMFQFHYSVMQAHFGGKLQLLYTDTDSLIYQIESDSITDDLAPLARKGYFDFSNYPPDHPLYNTDLKRVPGVFKDESKGTMISHFVGLRSKMYCLKKLDEHGNAAEFKYAKGVKKPVIENSLRFDNYLECLLSNKQFQHAFHSITPKAHNVSTSHQVKVSLSPFDDKRAILSDGISTLPYGHYKLSSCGEEEESSAPTHPTSVIPDIHTHAHTPIPLPVRRRREKSAKTKRRKNESKARR